MVRGMIYLLSIGILFSQDDGLPPNFVYLEPIEDFFARDPISLEIIVTDRNEIDRVTLFYRFNDELEFNQREMEVASQPVIFNVSIPLDEVVPGFFQYYFWARDEFGNEVTWPSGGEDLPMILPIYSIKKEEEKVPKEIHMLVKEYKPPEKLEDNLPYYLEIGMLAPAYEVTYEEGVPIIVISVYDTEQIIDPESIKLLVDGKEVTSFNDPDMITYIPLDFFNPGYHVVRYEANNLSGEMLVKDFLFFVNEKIIVESESEKITWKEKIKFKGDLGWNTDYDPYGNIIDVHKINSSIKFQLGDYKFNLSGLTSTNIYDVDAREAAKYNQPTSRFKFKMKSPYLDFNYGDNSAEFSDFSLKGTRVRGIHANIKWGTWVTSFISGETKHWIDSEITEDLINVWNPGTLYYEGDQVYDNSITWVVITDSTTSEPCDFNIDTDTCIDNSDWFELEESEYAEIPNDVCNIVEPRMYGLDPDTSSGISFDPDNIYWIWNGSSCEEVFVYSTINMITGQDGTTSVGSSGIKELYDSYDECRNFCMVPVKYKKGSPVRELQGFRTSKDFYKHAKFGISAIRSLDVRDEDLIPYLALDDYAYEGNIAAAGDFMFHFNNDRTILRGEYGISMTINQAYSDTLLLKKIHNIDQSLYSYTDWNGVDYCYQNEQCSEDDWDDFGIDINGDTLITTPASQLIEGVSDSLLNEIAISRENLKDFEKILGFSLNDDINGYAEGRGVSGLTGPEAGNFIDGNVGKRIDLLLKKPAFKVAFKTPITLSFTEFNFQTELNQAPLNYVSHGSSSIQTDVRNWKNKLGFKLMKNQLNFSFGYDYQKKSPWDPESEDDGEYKRSVTDTKSGSIGLSFRDYPGLNYSIRIQNREDLTVNFANGVLNKTTTGLKNIFTHTLAPSYKIGFGNINININGNITLVNDIDTFSDQEGCFEILNNTANNKWGGISDTTITQSGDTLVCEGNNFYFSKSNNPLRDSGNLTSTYTGSFSFSFPSQLSLNLGLGLSINSPSDLRQSKTVITVLSGKLGYKFFEKKLNVSLGSNYVIGYKGGNGFWDSNENLYFDDGDDGQFNQGDQFRDEVELDNNKFTLKVGLQYKVPDQNIAIGLNMNYSQTTDNLTKSHEDPVYKAKVTIKYGF